jgi:signal transduction histidine kinase
MRMDPRMPERLLARSVAHELRQPLSLIIGYAELLASRRPDGDEQAALVAAIRAAADRMAASLARLDRPEELRPRQLGPEELLDLRPAPGVRPMGPAA